MLKRTCLVAALVAGLCVSLPAESPRKVRAGDWPELRGPNRDGISVEKGLISGDELGRAFQQMAGFRVRLTHHYEEVTDAELFGILTERLGDLQAVREQLGAAAARLAAPGSPG